MTHIKDLGTKFFTEMVNGESAFIGCNISKPMFVDTECGKLEYNVQSKYDCLRYLRSHPVNSRVGTSDQRIELAARQALDKICLEAEKQFTSDVLKDTTWGSVISGVETGKCWDNYVDSHPVKDISAARLKMLEDNGVMLNVAVCSYQLFETLRQHPEIANRKILSKPGLESAKGAMAHILGLDKVIVADGVENHNFIFDKSSFLLLAQKEGRPDRSAIQTVIPKYIESGFNINSVNEPQVRDAQVVVECYLDFAIINPGFGCLFSSITK